MKNNLREIKKDLSALSLQELEQVKIWLDKYLKKAEADIEIENLAQEKRYVEEFQKNGRTYRLQLVRCGKEPCKCAEGTLHGPYWYAYWLENGRTKSKYLGRKISKD